ncbi:hypothetical protein ACKUWK_018300 [Proteus mirabilis]
MPMKRLSEDKMISEQLLELDSLFFVRSNYVGFGNPEDESSKAETNTTFARTISAKKLPRRFQEGSAQYFLGDLMNGATGIKNPCIITMTLVYPDQQNAKKYIYIKTSTVLLLRKLMDHLPDGFHIK